MPAITGTINQSEQFSDGGGTIVGLKNVNIRSLGIPRTLVLFNVKESLQVPVLPKRVMLL